LPERIKAGIGRDHLMRASRQSAEHIPAGFVGQDGQAELRQVEIPPADVPTSRGRPGQSGRPTTLPPNIAASLAKLAGKPVKSSAGE